MNYASERPVTNLICLFISNVGWAMIVYCCERILGLRRRAVMLYSLGMKSTVYYSDTVARLIYSDLLLFLYHVSKLDSNTALRSIPCKNVKPHHKSHNPSHSFSPNGSLRLIHDAYFFVTMAMNFTAKNHTVTDQF